MKMRSLQHVNSALFKIFTIKKIKPYPSVLLLNGRTANTNEEKAKLFNLFPQSVFNSKISRVENEFHLEEKDINRIEISEEIESILFKGDTNTANVPDDK